MVEWLFLAVPWGYLLFVIVIFPNHTHYFSRRGTYDIKITFGGDAKLMILPNVCVRLRYGRHYSMILNM